MTIARLMQGKNADIYTIAAEKTVRDAIVILAQRRIGALPVMEGEDLAGVFSERDVIYQLQANGPEVLDYPVRQVMTSPAVTVDPDTDVLTALALMTRRRIRHLPVVQDGRMIGVVSIGDLVKSRIERIESEAEALRTYIQTA